MRSVLLVAAETGVVSMFEQKSHAVAAIGGWVVLLLLCAPGVPLWVPLVWGVTGWVVLRPRWVAGGDKRRLYGFGIWLGFAYAWPYVLRLQLETEGRRMGTGTEQRIADFLPDEERNLIVSGLQALWRERVTAFNVAAYLAAERGQDAPAEAAFGIGEVVEGLRRWGAAPQKF